MSGLSYAGIRSADRTDYIHSSHLKVNYHSSLLNEVVVQIAAVHANVAGRAFSKIRLKNMILPPLLFYGNDV